MLTMRGLNVRGAALLSRGLFSLQSRGLAAGRADRKYVRIAGATAYSTRDDLIEFMRRNDVDVSRLDAASSRRLEAVVASGPVPEYKFNHGKTSMVQADSSDEGAVLDDTEPDIVSSESEYVARAPSVVESGETILREDSGSSSKAASGSGTPLLGQGKCDIFMNHSVWMYEAESGADAQDIVRKISGKVCGMRLVRASAVDLNVAKEVPGVVAPERAPEISPGIRLAHRWRMGIIAPSPEERDRVLLVVGLPKMVSPRSVWSFFGAYDVIAVRMLRRDGMASVVFRETTEAHRALRERGNLPLNDHGKVTIKMYN
jgi:hypothetical protein